MTALEYCICAISLVLSLLILFQAPQLLMNLIYGPVFRLRKHVLFSTGLMDFV